MKSDRYNKKTFTNIVLNSNNLTDVAKNLNLKPFCGNRNTIKKYINYMILMFHILKLIIVIGELEKNVT